MKKIIGSKLLKVTIAFTLVAGLVLAMAFPVMAKENGNNNGKSDSTRIVKMSTLKGKVESKDVNSFVISFKTDNADNETTIKVDDNTKFYLVQAAPFAKAVKDKVQEKIQDFKDNKQGNQQNGKLGNLPNNLNQRDLGNKNGQTEITPTASENEDDELDSAMENTELELGLIRNEQGPQGFLNRVKSMFGGWPKFGQVASFKDLEEGDAVIVRLMPNEDLAKQVLIIKPSNIKKVSGTIEKVGDNYFTVNPEEGDNVDLIIDSDTRVTLKGAMGIADDQWATVVYKDRENDQNLAILVNVLLEKPAPKTTTTSETED